jgi:FkbM family methyltransferase
VGANKGWKSDTFERLGREVIAIEPDATNAVYMRRRFLKKPVRVLQMAVSKQNGKATFFVEESGSAFNTLSEKWVRTLEDKEATRFSTVCDFNASVVVELVTLDELIERYGRPAYIKIDIEGAEVDAIRGLSVPVPLLSFELNLPEFSEEGLQSLELLHDLAGDVVFNWSASCEQGFEMDHWQPYLRFRDFLENTSVRYMEVYASMPV